MVAFFMSTTTGQYMKMGRTGVFTIVFVRFISIPESKNIGDYSTTHRISISITVEDKWSLYLQNAYQKNSNKEHLRSFSYLQLKQCRNWKS
jgi:hypothetical protein